MVFDIDGPRLAVVVVFMSDMNDRRNHVGGNLMKMVEEESGRKGGGEGREGGEGKEGEGRESVREGECECEGECEGV